MKEYEHSLPDIDEINKYPKDSQRKNYEAYNNFVNNNFQNNDFENQNNNNQNANLINDDNNEDNMNININHYQYAGDPNNKEENSQMDSQSIKEREEINYSIFKGFLYKVYGIISFQLLVTLIVILIFQNDSVSNYFNSRPVFTGFLNFLSFVGFIATLIVLAVKQDFSKKVPYNYISLFILTLFISFMCAFLSLNFSKDSVIFCTVLTLISSIAITVYAYYSTQNWGTIKALILVILSQSGGFLLMILLLGNTMVEKVMCFVGTLLFGVYLVYDTQIIMKKFGETYKVDDYIFAAIQIYLDIINLFMMILSVFGKNKNK